LPLRELTREPLAPTRGALRTRRLFGLDFVDDDDLDRVVAHIISAELSHDAAGGSLPFLVTPNVDYVVRLQDSPRDVRVATEQARFVLPDGQPIVWASRLARVPLSARLPGSTLFPKLWRRLVASDLPVVLVTSCPEVSERLTLEHPAAEALVAPWLAAGDSTALDEFALRCRDAVRQTGTRFVVLGIGWPNQQLLASRVLELLGPDATPPLFLLLGASLDMYCGLVERAPSWMQRSGLEWFHRFRLEPRRLFRRYFVTDMKFLPLAAREVVGQRRLARSS
jgi:N-acetylglucosaminyldiphosphoundecaprenol N-acetyl-beta-D-mannosaminyltransferase